MKRAISGVLTVALAAVVTLLITMGSASPHTPASTADCATGVHVTLSSYSPAGVNTVSVSLDGAVVTANPDFGASYSVTVPNPDKTVAHTYEVVVTAWDGAKYGLDQTGTIPACEVAPTTTTQPHQEPPTDPQVPAPPVAAPPMPVLHTPIFTG